MERRMKIMKQFELDKDNRCKHCKRIVVGLKPGDMHDHVEKCPDCGREREVANENK